MRYDRKRELPTAVPDKTTFLRSKSRIILIRWPVVLISCSLVVFRATPTQLPLFVVLAVALYALSNISLYFFDESRFHELQFIFWLIALDTVVLTTSLMVNGGAKTNLYLAYFLLIIVCAIFENPRAIAVISLGAPFIYAALFFYKTDHNFASYLQLAFLSLIGISR